MKRRLISALATGLLVFVILASTPGISRASVDDQDKPAPSQPSQGKPTTPGAWDAPGLPKVPAGSGFTYQGSLKDGPNPANGQYDLQFTLYDALSAGNQVGSPVVVTNQMVTNGLFAVQLDFGSAAFQGSGRWLEIAVKPSGGGNYTTLSPRQPLTAAPYAMSLAPGAVVSGTNGSTILRVDNGGSGNGMYGLHSASTGTEPGVRGETGSTDYGATGLLGRVTSTAPGFDSAAVRGINNGTGASGIGVWGEQYGSGYGVFGRASTGSGVVGFSGGTNTAGVWGQNNAGFGVFGNGLTGVAGTGTSGDGVRGQSSSGSGGNFFSSTGYGVFASSNGPAAGYFTSAGNGVFAQSSNASGIVGVSTYTDTAGVFGTDYLGSGLSGIGRIGVSSLGVGGDAVKGQSYGGFGGNFSSDSSYGVYAESNNEAEGVFSSTTSYGVAGRSASSPGGYFTSGSAAGVYGVGRTGVSGIGSDRDGVNGQSISGFGGNFSSAYSYGVYAESNYEAAGVFSSTTSYGVVGRSASGPGGYFTSGSDDAVRAFANGTNVSGLAGFNSGAGPGTYGTSGTGPGVSGQSDSGPGVNGASNSGVAGYFSSNSGNGVYGVSSTANGIVGVTTYTSTAGVSGIASSGYGVWGNGLVGVLATGSGGEGIRALSNTGDGVHAISNTGVGGNFTSASADAVQGHANGTNVSGVAGFNIGAGPGTYGTSGTGPGVSGLSTTGNGGDFTSDSGKGVHGQSNTGIGVFGESAISVGGVFKGQATSLLGQAPTTLCSTCYAGDFAYNVRVNGTLSANVKQFKIDDPLDPANKYLVHTSVESPDMLNIYRGHVTLDAQGSAWVQMPDYFQALNQDFDYQLTAIGKAQPNLYVAQEIKDNKFQISGGVPGAKVSWQVTGVRHDPYADAHRSPVEQEKSPEEKGLYLNPELYNQPASKGINTIHQQDDNKQPQSTTIGKK